MSETVLTDKKIQPNDEILIETIGQSYKYYESLKKHLLQKYDNVSEEWKYYGKKYGWQLKIFQKKRNLLFLIPYRSYFSVVLIFGDRAVDKILESEIKDEFKEKIKSAKKYLEGRGISIEVKDGDYLEDLKKLIEIKQQN
jgi:hypothetical protein